MPEFPSIVNGMEAAEYHQVPALNASSITSMLDCPAMCAARFAEAIEPTDSMRLGTLVHSLVLEPETVNGLYAVMTEPGNTKAGKQQKAEALEKGLEPVSPSMWKTASDMAGALKAHPAVAKLLALPGDSEVSIFWKHEIEDGPTIECKGRIDRLVQLPAGMAVALDLKTAVSANPADLGRKVHDFGYHRQAAWYLEGLRAVGVDARSFVFAFVRNQPPHLVSVAVLSEDALKLGMADCMKAARMWAECAESGTWPGYGDEIYTLDLPPWAYRK